MADFTALKTAIQTYIKQNGNEEITGNILQEVLLSVVTTLGDSAINDLITALGNEVTARQQADGTLQQNITNEATARGNADTALSNRLGSTITAENTAAAQIGAEAEARESADTALQGLIDGITDNIENGYVYAGIATPSTTPTTGKVFYLALTAGTYTNFGNTEVSQGINILKYNGSAWSLDAFIGIDDELTSGSNKLPKSGNVLENIIKNGSAFDLSAYNAEGGVLATYADLNAALTALNALPAVYKQGGMSFRFVSTSNNKYVQYRLVSDTFNTSIANWQKSGAEVTVSQNTETGDLTLTIGDNNYEIESLAKIPTSWIGGRQSGQKSSIIDSTGQVYNLPYPLPSASFSYAIIDVSSYIGRNIIISAYNIGSSAYSVFTDTDDVLIESWQYYTKPHIKNVPIGAKWLKISNDFSINTNPYVCIASISEIANKVSLIEKQNIVNSWVGGDGVINQVYDENGNILTLSPTLTVWFGTAKVDISNYQNKQIAINVISSASSAYCHFVDSLGNIIQSFHHPYNINDLVQEELPITVPDNARWLLLSNLFYANNGATKIMVNPYVRAINLNEKVDILSGIGSLSTDDCDNTITLNEKDDAIYKEILLDYYTKSSIINPIIGLNSPDIYTYKKTSASGGIVPFVVSAQDELLFGIWLKKTDYPNGVIFHPYCKYNDNTQKYGNYTILQSDFVVGCNKSYVTMNTLLNSYTITEQRGDYYFFKIQIKTSDGGTQFVQWMAYEAPDGNVLNKEYSAFVVGNPNNPYLMPQKIHIKDIQAKFKLQIPNIIYSYVGDTIQIFKYPMLLDRSEVNLNMYIATNNNTIRSRGRNLERYFEHKSNENGDFLIGANVIDSELNLKDEAYLTIKVITPTNPSSKKNILCIGDSLTEGQCNNSGVTGYTGDELTPPNTLFPYTNELKAFLTTDREATSVLPAGLNLTNYQLIGSMNTSGGRHEGHGGWTIESFFRNGSPFFIGGKVDFNAYLAQDSIYEDTTKKGVDIVYILLGANNASFGYKNGLKEEFYNTYQTQILDMINAIKAQLIDDTEATYYNPNLKIVLMSYPMPYYGYGFHPYGSEKFTDGTLIAHKLNLIHKANQFIVNLPQYNGIVSELHLSPFVDSDNAYVYTNKPKNRYMTETEVVKLEAIHPNSIGYKQMAAAIARDIIGKNV